MKTESKDESVLNSKCRAYVVVRRDGHVSVGKIFWTRKEARAAKFPYEMIALVTGLKIVR